jgi:dTDP-3-amino-3,4,6-trideoxy-alpha-D-glucose transaminase
MMTPVKMNPFGRLWVEVRSDVLNATERVGASGWYVLGREVEAFETAFAQFCGAPAVVGVASGLDAIEVGLRALGIEPGQPVLTTPLTAFATTLAIFRAGGVPVYVDVDEHGILDLDRCEALLEKRGDIRYCVPVHLYGQCADLRRLRELKEKFDLRVVEDAAQAPGASFEGEAVGSVGDVTAYSFYPTKNLGAFGDAGALTCRNESLGTRARSMRNYGQSAHYVHDELGLNSRLDELHAAILREALLPRLQAWTERRREIAGRYREALDGTAVSPLPITDAGGCVYHLFPIRVRVGTRDAFRDFLAAAKIESGVHYPTLTFAQKAIAGEYSDVQAPLALAIANQQVSLPIHPLITDDEVSRVCERCRAWETFYD